MTRRKEERRNKEEEQRQEQYRKQLVVWSGTAGSKKMVLYKATRDGFSAQDFRDKCNNQGETWTIVEDVVHTGESTRNPTHKV